MGNSPTKMKSVKKFAIKEPRPSAVVEVKVDKRNAKNVTLVSKNKHPLEDTSAGPCKDGLTPQEAEDYCNNELEDCNGYWLYDNGRTCPKKNWGKGFRTVAGGAFYEVQDEKWAGCQTVETTPNNIGKTDCPQSGTLQEQKQKITNSRTFDNKADAERYTFPPCDPGYTAGAVHKVEIKTWSPFSANDWKYTRDCNINDKASVWDERYAPKTSKQQIECCGIDYDIATSTQKKECAPFCQAGKKCSTLMQKYCACGENKFDENGDGGSGNFFDQKCQKYLKNPENEVEKNSVLQKLCSQGDNWKSERCRTFCEMAPEKCKSMMNKECSKPANWGNQQCMNWCNAGCDSGLCENETLCSTFVELPENCGTENKRGAKYESNECRGRRPLDSSGIKNESGNEKYAGVGPALNAMTSCIIQGGDFYKNRACPGNITNCVQNFSGSGGRQDHNTQEQNCNQIPTAVQEDLEKLNEGQEEGSESSFDENEEESDDEIVDDTNDEPEDTEDPEEPSVPAKSAEADESEKSTIPTGSVEKDRKSSNAVNEDGSSVKARASNDVGFIKLSEFSTWMSENRNIVLASGASCVLFIIIFCLLLLIN